MTKTTEETKERLKESGHIFVFWGIRIKKLQDSGHIKVKKSFKNNYPDTSLSITRKASNSNTYML